MEEEKAKLFYQNSTHLFYVENTSYLFPKPRFFAGKEHSCFAIVAVDKSSGEKRVLYNFQSVAGIIVKYSVGEASYIEEGAELRLPLTFYASALFPVPFPKVSMIVTFSIAGVNSATPTLSILGHEELGATTENERRGIDGLVKRMRDFLTK